MTVVIPLFNKARYVRRAVQSVLMQTWRDFEIVVVDDGSTDGGAEIVRGMRDARIRLVRQANEGVSSARNRGIMTARNELVAFLDADDRYNPGFLSVIRGLREKYPDAGAYGTSFEIIGKNADGGVTREVPARAAGGRDVLISDYFENALSRLVLCASATAIPKATFEAIGLFAPGVPSGEDLDMWVRIGASFPIAVSGYIGAVYHKDAYGRADDGRIEESEPALVRTGLRLLSSGSLTASRRRNLRECVAMVQIHTASRWILQGRRVQARRLLLRSKTRRFFLRKVWWLFWTHIPTRATLLAQEAKGRLLSRRVS